MKDKRAIIIKDPRLQKIRNALGNIILEAYHIQYKSIHNKGRTLLIKDDGTNQDIDELSPNKLKKFRQLQKQESKLRDLARRSICMCVSCGRGDQDMVYNKPYNAWYCTECYGMHLASARERFNIQPYLQLPEDHPFFTGQSNQIYNTLMTEADMWLDSLILEHLMMYDRDIDEHDIRNEFLKLPPKLQKLWILEAWLQNPDFAENLKKFNEKRKQGKKKPSTYKYNTFIFRVLALPIKSKSKQKLKRKTKPQDPEEEALDDLYTSFL
jgi:hypothetical protein